MVAKLTVANNANPPDNGYRMLGSSAAGQQMHKTLSFLSMSHEVEVNVYSTEAIWKTGNSWKLLT